MSDILPTPTTTRAKIVYFIWYNLPRVVLLAMIALIFILMGSIKDKSETIAADKANAIRSEKPAVNVVTLKISPTTITDRINLPGAIEPWTRLELMSKLSGTVNEVMVHEGQTVKRGDIIARMEAEDYKIALQRAEAAFNLATAEYNRDKSIYEKGVIPASSFEANKTNMQTAQADFENAKLLLSRTTITSPMDGVIRRMDAKIGLQLSVGDPIAEILEISKLKGVIGIPESDVSAVRPLETVDISIQALDNRVIPANKYFLSSSPETFARIYNLELEIDNSDGEILAGMFIRADIVKKQVDKALTVPFYSVVSRNNEQYVFIEEDGVAKKRIVTLGIMEKWMVQVIDGLTNDDKLILEGHRDVEDGQKVTVVKAISTPEELSL